MRILIADDSSSVRRGVVRILSNEQGWQVCGEAANGEEAIHKAQELRPDIILLDISMPGMSGLEAARLLREKVPGAKILIMSQHDPATLFPSAVAAGAHALIDKSRLATDLLPSIRKIGLGSTIDRTESRPCQ